MVELMEKLFFLAMLSLKCGERKKKKEVSVRFEGRTKCKTSLYHFKGKNITLRIILACQKCQAEKRA